MLSAPSATTASADDGHAVGEPVNDDVSVAYSTAGDWGLWREEQESRKVLSIADEASAMVRGNVGHGTAARSSPALQQPSRLFDTAVATEALFARVQQQKTIPGQSQLHPRPLEAKAPSQRTSGTISSILGRPPPAPLTTETTAVSPMGGAHSCSYPTQQRDTVASSPPLVSSAQPGRYRTSSPASSVDYVEIEHKQSELRHAVEHHIQSLERSLALRDEEVATLSSRLHKLEEDYQFNYNLIAERDAALEEASGQLQGLYRELKRLTDESTRMEKTIESADSDVKMARQRVREVEEERDAAVRQVQRDYAIKERHLAESFRAREAALEEEVEKQHAWYKARAKALEEERATMTERTALVSTGAEERYRQQVTRLQSEVMGLQQALKDARQQKDEADKRIVAVEETNSELMHGLTAAQQRHEALAQEAALAKKEMEDQIVRAVRDTEKRVTATETMAREEAGRASRAELERTRLQSMLAEAQERLQHLTSRYDEDVARFTKERHQLLKSSDEAMEAASSAEQVLHETKRELEQQRRLAAEEATRFHREVKCAQEASEAARQELVSAEEKCERWRTQAQHLEAEVRRWKEEESKTASNGRQECSAWEEKYRHVELQLQLLQEEAQQSKKVQQGMVERAQAEVARLTRELHASEAARRALEDQYHLLDDFKEDRHGLQTLRAEKEQLQKRVAELEHTNAEVRLQVSNFTAELANDPVIKAAKETQERCVALQQELTQARAESQLLQDSLKDKEEELIRLQTEILRVQVLVANDETGSLPVDPRASPTPGAVSLSDHVSRALQRQQRQMRSEYSRMRESYEEMVREMDRQRRRRRKPARRSRTASVASSSSRSSSSPTSDAQPALQHRRRAGGEQQSAAGVSVPPALPDSKTAHLLQESEMWRQRCVELEQQLLTVLRERDRLKKDLQLANQDVAALGAEKACLVDLNSLLKAQLREAYRLRVGNTNSAPGRESVMSNPAGNSNGVHISPQLLAEALESLKCKDRTSDETVGKPRVRNANASESRATRRVSRAEEESATRESPVVHSTRGFVSPSPSSVTKQSISAQQAQERLATLEHEIEVVREQLATASTSTQQQHKSGQGVVRRGNAAVRHYGLSD